MKSIIRTDYAVFNAREVLVKTFDNEQSAREYADHRTAMLGPLTVAVLTTTRKNIT